MKTYILFLALLISGLSLAQSGINYKAVVKDGSGNILANETIDVEFTIIKNVGIVEVYKELHSAVNTGANGIIVLNIGEGTPSVGTYALINWKDDSYFLKTQIDTGSGLVDLGTTEFKEVPFAATAKTISDAPNRTLEIAGSGSQKLKINSTTGGTPSLELLRTGTSIDWRISNASTWLDIIVSDDDFVTPVTKFSFRNNGRLGINNNTPQEELHVTGTIRSTDLAGTGTRNVVATSNGNLAPDTQTKYLSLNPAAFVPTRDGREPDIGTGYISAGTGSSPVFARFVASVDLPQGATVTNFKFYFIDNNSVQGVSAALISKFHTSTGGVTFDGLVSNSVGPSSSVQSVEDSDLSIGTINNALYSYAVELSSTAWNILNMRVTGVLISYTLP